MVCASGSERAKPSRVIVVAGNVHIVSQLLLECHIGSISGLVLVVVFVLLYQHGLMFLMQCINISLVPVD